tara:strand:+ start:119 stop:2077 length:1959 start_codon:yes stop_codon:yes gene_type:complete
MKSEKYDDAFGTRIALMYPYDPDTNQLLKDTLNFPAFKWDKDRRVWSIKDEPSIIRQAVELLGTRNYDFSHLLDGIVKSRDTNFNPCHVATKGKNLILRWPFISDQELRDEVRLTVRSIPNWKYLPEDKAWSIPIVHGHTLYNLLEKKYQPLAEALKANPDIADYIAGNVKRVSISQATELNDEAVKKLKKRLKGVFPKGLELYPFQYVGVAFAELAEGRCLIGDEMGIGKTIQAIAFSALHHKPPFIVVCPSNVKYSWYNELRKWLPDKTVHVVNSGKEDIPMSDFIIINYELVLESKQLPKLLSLIPIGVIIDESHYLKNSKAQRTKATLELAQMCDYVLCLSGTAISSRPVEFFNTLNLLSPDQFPNEWKFKMRYCDAWDNGFGWDFSGASHTKELNERIRDFTIRRLKSEVLPELPPKTRTFLPVSKHHVNRTEYEQAMLDWNEQYEGYMNFGGMPKGFVLNMLTDLRHQCGLMKVDFAASWIEDYRQSTGKPIVVYCHHRDVLDNLKHALQEKGLHTAVISGDVPADERGRIVTAFQEEHIPVLICNTVAAKEGITLTAADTVLFIEREWVPSHEEQAEDRVYRIGQESDSVHAIYLSCIGTIDEHFDRIVEQKRSVVKSVLDGSSTEMGRQTLLNDLLERLREERI